MRRALILAAGKGTRMKTEIPKCAYPILNKPMILYQVEALERAKKCNRLNNKTEMRTHQKIDLSWFNKTDYQNWVNKHFLN